MGEGDIVRKPRPPQAEVVRGLGRRSLLKASAVAAAMPGQAIAATPDRDLVKRENLHAGADDWQLTRMRLDVRGGIRSSKIEGYASRQSVTAGQTLDFFVSTNPVQEYRIEIFRTGYYGGAGARLLKTIGPLKGSTQPTPEQGQIGRAHV